MNKLILLIGPSGSGKTTWAENFIVGKNIIYLSSDKLRQTIGGDESNQECSGRVFDFMETATKYFLSQKLDVLIDATNYRPKNRAAFISIGRMFRANIVTYCFNTPLGLCVSRNAQRKRQVPVDIIEKQYNNLSWPLMNEVDEINFI